MDDDDWAVGMLNAALAHRPERGPEEPSAGRAPADHQQLGLGRRADEYPGWVPGGTFGPGPYVLLGTGCGKVPGRQRGRCPDR